MTVRRPPFAVRPGLSLCLRNRGFVHGGGDFLRARGPLRQGSDDAHKKRSAPCGTLLYSRQVRRALLFRCVARSVLVYFGEQQTGKVLRMPVAGGVKEELAAEGGVQVGFGLSPNAVYWREVLTDSGIVWRVAR